MKRNLLLCVVLFVVVGTKVYSQVFTRQDSLRGTITPERVWWDLQHYHLWVEVDPSQKFIKGSNIITYKVLDGGNMSMQIDLQPPMKITRVEQDGKELKMIDEGNAHFVQLQEDQGKNDENKIIVYFEGTPVVANNPPWDGGFTWTKDGNGLPFIATSNQGIGSSVWWPNKDIPYDEPDNGVHISIEVPENLMDVSNGRLINVEHNKIKKTKTYHWEVKNPINNYGININIGDYVHFGEKYKGEKGVLDMDYYVLRENLSKAKKQFEDARKMMEAFEYWFGPYPFYEDSYKLVEAPYLGMEHQSSVTYGNGYMNGYRGRDLSKTGWGLKWDFIIIHESGHEWFANNITNKDVADMWLHEGFTAYSENIFLNYHFGKEASEAYVKGTRMNIQNDRPIIGTYGVSYEGSSDMYYKGANLLHTIRQIVNDDDKWRGILRGINKEFYHKTVTTAQIEKYISQKSGTDLSKVFDQYLRDVRIPILEYLVKGDELQYRWSNTVEGFDMPVKVMVNDNAVWLQPKSNRWKVEKIKTDVAKIIVDTNFYVGSIQIL